MICAVIAPGLPQPGQWDTWTARTALFITSWLPVFAPPHFSLGTQNEVPVTAYMRFSRSRRWNKGRRAYNMEGTDMVTSSGLSGLKNIPSTVKYIFRAKLRVFYKSFSKIFSSRLRPRSMLSFTDMNAQPSFLAISAMLMPRK